MSVILYNKEKAIEGIDKIEEAQKYINGKSSELLVSLSKIKGNPDFAKYIAGDYGFTSSKFDSIQECIDNAVKMMEKLKKQIESKGTEIEKYASQPDKNQPFLYLGDEQVSLVSNYNKPTSKHFINIDNIDDLSEYDLALVETKSLASNSSNNQINSQYEAEQALNDKIKKASIVGGLASAPKVSKQINSQYDVEEILGKKTVAKERPLKKEEKITPINSQYEAEQALKSKIKKASIASSLAAFPKVEKQINSQYDVEEMILNKNKEKNNSPTSTSSTVTYEKLDDSVDTTNISSSDSVSDTPEVSSSDNVKEESVTDQTDTSNVIDESNQVVDTSVPAEEVQASEMDESIVEDESSSVVEDSATSVVATPVENTENKDNVTVYEGPVRVVGEEKHPENVVSNQNYVPHNNQNNVSPAPQTTPESAPIEPEVNSTPEVSKSVDTTTPSTNTQKKITPITVDDTVSDTKSHSNPLPIIGGVAVAGTAIGLGTKAILDRRKNMQQDEEDTDYEEVEEDEDAVIEDGSEIIEPADNMVEEIGYEDVDDNYDEEDLVSF